MILPQRVRQFLSFAVVGGLATGIQFLILIVAVEWLGQTAAVGSAAGFLISAVCNYLVNYHFTFRSSASHTQAALRFAVVAAGGLALTAILMWLLPTYARIPYLLAQVITSGAVLVWNYCGNAFWSFAASATADERSRESR